MTATPVLSTIVAKKVTLKVGGAGRFIGLCPFHDERTPSFMVDDSAARFHCLGCGAKGDAMDFVFRSGLTKRAYQRKRE